MGSQVKRLLHLSVGANSIQVALNSCWFVHTSSIFKMHTGWSMPMNTKFQMVLFVSLTMMSKFPSKVRKVIEPTCFKASPINTAQSLTFPSPSSTVQIQSKYVSILHANSNSIPLSLFSSINVLYAGTSLNPVSHNEIMLARVKVE